ncbi:conserved membrane hypothetical protein [uncultured delta proteobacterium]|uniref:EamA domain-containing protein n=1 Tax=uncultured delta proteobacterium TaxID=34034 RepID=A0A212JEB2_9DELT|nr:conserved membrane hypothetical protein [uncultured delta proteobacterium]
MPFSLTPARVGVLMALGAISGWSFNFFFSRALAGVLPPFTFTLLRTVVALIAFAPFALGAFIRCWPYLCKRPVFYIFLSLTGIGYYNALIYTAGQTTPVINMALLALSSPVFTLALARILYNEPLPYRRLFGLATALCGVTLLVARGDLGLLKTLSFHTGDFLMLTGAFIFASYSVSLRRIDPEVSSYGFIYTMFVVSFVFLLPFAGWELARGMTVDFTPMAVAGILYLGIVASIFCYICWNGAIARIGSGNVALIYYTMPFFSGMEAVLLLGEPLRWFHFASGALIIAGVLVATRR